MAWFGGIALYFFDTGGWLKTTAVQINILLSLHLSHNGFEVQ